MALNPAEACGLIDQSIPQWKRELIIRRRALGRTLQVGSSSVKLTCPSVVALVRQPEVLDASENVITSKQQRSLANEESSSNSSLNQNQVDFHPSTSSAVPIGNMRLLDTCSDVNNLINGIDVKNKQSDVSSDLCMNYNLIMGEDKSLNPKKKSASPRSKLDNCSRQQNMPVDKVTRDEANDRLGKDDDCLSDSSEELQYGPGIVNKLKTKYLSMTLREQKRSSRPSLVNLRRAASLENMFEGDGNLNKQNKSVTDTSIKTEHVTVNRIRGYSGSQIGLSSHRVMKHLGARSLETMKRARSMDTLLKAESRISTKKNNFGLDDRQNILNSDFSINCGKPIASIVNENIIIVENTSVGLTNETSGHGDISSDDSCKHLKRTGSATADKELPPPDLVKQTLKIFETSPKRKGKNPHQTNLAKLAVGFSNSSSQPLNRTADKTKNHFKPTLSPKPVLSPEKLRQNRSRVSSPKKLQSNSSAPSNNVRTPTKINTNLEKKQLQLDTSSSTNSDVSRSEKMVGITSPKITSPRSVSPVVTVVSDNEHVSTAPLIGLLNKNHTVQHSQRTNNENDLALQLEEFEEVDSTECSKPVPQSALENIRRGGVSMQFSFKNENSNHSSVSKSYLPRAKSPPQALNTSLLHKQLEKTPPSATIASLRSQSTPHTKQVGIIRPLVTSKIHTSHSSPVLTEKEIEKNLINRVKSIEQPISKVVVAIKALPDNVVLGSVASDVTNKNVSVPHVCVSSKVKAQGLWDEKLWHQNQNTIVFNFSDRKEVPDYIENDGLILKGKRERPRPGEGGIILLTGSAVENATDFEELLASEPPSPCDVIFEGDNVLINGKSNLKKNPKQVKLRIKFNDEATTMFEYPSEASLVEEETSAVNGASSSGECSSQASAPPHAADPSPSQVLNVPIGGSLGAYTPRQMGGRDWQLGVTPVQHPPVVPVEFQQTHDEDHLKPAPPESTVVWSEDTAADLLF